MAAGSGSHFNLQVPPNSHLMDPLSITTGVLSVVGQSIKLFQTINGYVNKYKIAELSIASTRITCSTIQLALLKLQDLLIQNQSTAQTDSEDSFAFAIQEYEGVLSACSVAFSLLNQRLTELNIEDLNKHSKSTFTSKFRAVWNDDEMRMVREHVQNQAVAISLLLATFQAGAWDKTHRLLKETQNRKILDSVSNDARTLLSKSHRARTITGNVGLGDVESSGSVIGDEQFDFDDIVINSAAYRRAYYSYTRAHKIEKKEEKESNADIATVPSLAGADFLVVRDDDYFEARFNRLITYTESWVLRFSKVSDLKRCRLSSEISDHLIINRLDDVVLDGTDVDTYLADRVQRRSIFESVLVAMLWEYIFTRYLFGMERGRRQVIKSVEREIGEVASASTVALWRAMTCSAVSMRPEFQEQCELDTAAVIQEIFYTLTSLLPPPSDRNAELKKSLTSIVRDAVDLSIEMRKQRPQYTMLPALRPEYDANGDLVSTVCFNANLMNERSSAEVPNEELEAQQVVVRIMLFPLVVRKGDYTGAGDEEIVVCPAQVLVSSRNQKARQVSPIELV